MFLRKILKVLIVYISLTYPYYSILSQTSKIAKQTNLYGNKIKYFNEFKPDTILTNNNALHKTFQILSGGASKYGISSSMEFVPINKIIPDSSFLKNKFNNYKYSKLTNFLSDLNSSFIICIEKNKKTDEFVFNYMNNYSFREKNYLCLENIGLNLTFNKLQLNFEQQVTKVTNEYVIDYFKNVHSYFSNEKRIDGYLLILSWGEKYFHNSKTFPIANTVAYFCIKDNVKKLNNYEFSISDFKQTIFALKKSSIKGSVSRIDIK